MSETDTTTESEPEYGRLRGGFRSGDGLQTTERAYACVESDVCSTGYDERVQHDPASWLLESDAVDDSIVAVDRAPDGSVVLFLEATGDDVATGTTIRLDHDAAARVGEALLKASDLM